MYLTQFCYACKYVSKCLHVGLPTYRQTDSQKLCLHYKGLVINELFTTANTPCTLFTTSPARGYVNVILCRDCF